MAGLYPIVRRVRRPLIPVDDRVKEEPMPVAWPVQPSEKPVVIERPPPVRKANEPHAAAKQPKS